MSHDLFSTKFCKDGKVDTLARTDYKEPPVVAYENKTQEVICLNFQGSKGMCGTSDDGKCYSLNAMHGHDVHVVCFAFDGYNIDSNDKTFKTITSGRNDTHNIPVVCFAFDSYYYKGQGEREGTEREFVVILSIGGTVTRATVTDGDKTPTMLARAGTVVGNEPIVLMRKEHETDRI